MDLKARGTSHDIKSSNFRVVLNLTVYFAWFNSFYCVSCVFELLMTKVDASIYQSLHLDTFVSAPCCNGILMPATCTFFRVAITPCSTSQICREKYGIWRCLFQFIKYDNALKYGINPFVTQHDWFMYSDKRVEADQIDALISWKLTVLSKALI